MNRICPSGTADRLAAIEVCRIWKRDCTCNVMSLDAAAENLSQHGHTYASALAGLTAGRTLESPCAWFTIKG